MNAIELSIFVSRMEAVCEEMGVVLKRTAFSPNIKDRLDFSCALFDAHGELCAQAAHIPVHLGSMAYAMADIVSRFDWHEGDMVILNDPFLGGTHLPDVTLIAPVFHQGRCLAFVVNRAHHANIGAEAPGSMPVSTSLGQEGIIIPPSLLMRGGKPEFETLSLLRPLRETRDSRQDELGGDLAAQASAVRVGVERLDALVQAMGPAEFVSKAARLNEYGERLAVAAIAEIPAGSYHFTDFMDDDGAGARDLPIQVNLEVGEGTVVVDFTGTGDQVSGNINCPLPVTAAAVFYVFRCLMPDHTPACAGIFRPISIRARPGSLVNALRPAAVAAGNVETSSRIVDAVLGALQQAMPERIPAASQGTMNNIAMGRHGGPHGWDYYETLGGGMGGGPVYPGGSALHSHMTNTLNTPVESLEAHYPLRIISYGIRRGSGGRGLHAGGDGQVREYEFLQPASVSLLTERRRHAPWGSAGGAAGSVGINSLNGRRLPAKTQFQVDAGDRLCIETPGGGGWGDPHRRKQELRGSLN